MRATLLTLVLVLVVLSGTVLGQSTGNIIFSRGGVGTRDYDIYTMDLHSSTASLLYHEPDVAELDQASYSPDGTIIAFSRHSWTANSGNLWIMNADGTNARSITNFPAGCDVLRLRFFTSDEIWLTLTNGWSRDLYKVTLSTQAVSRLTNYEASDQRLFDFDFNAQGDLVLSISPRTDCTAIQLYQTTTALTGTPVAFTNGAQDIHPRFSPDGRKLAFTRMSGCNGFDNICTLDWPNGTPQVLTSASSGQEAYVEPSWSPDGTQILCEYRSGAGSQFDLYLMNADGSGLHNITNTPNYDEVSGDWRRTESLIIPPIAVFPCDKSGFLQPVQVQASQPLSAVNVPLKIPAGVTIDSISRVGTATQGWPQFSDTVKVDSGFFQVLASAGNETLLPIGTSTVFNLFCHATPQCGTSQFIHWDTVLSGNQSRQLQFSDSQFITIYPGFSRLKDSSEIKGYKVGDPDNSGVVDLSDLSTMVAYLTGDNPTICIMNSMDVTRNGIIDLSDLSMLVAYLTGVPGIHLECTLPGPRLAVPDPNDQIALSTSYDNGQTLIAINSSIDLRAVQVVLKGYEGAAVNSQLGQLDLLKGDHQGTLTAILIDLKGKNMIEKGKTQLLEIPGNCEVVSASVSDMDFLTRTPTINGASKLNDLPTSFSLEQNYPNPFNPTTTISFSLPKTTNYTLTIYNVAGQVVKEFNGAAGPGTVHQVWDASKNASGVYFYRLTAGEFIQNKKMMLLK